MVIVYQCELFDEAGKVLEDVLQLIFKYYVLWKLKSNLTKTVISAFHLNNKEANRSPIVKINNECPKYLGIFLDRSLTFQQNLRT